MVAELHNADPPDHLEFLVNPEMTEHQVNPEAQEWTLRHHLSHLTKPQPARLASLPRTEILDHQDLPDHLAHLVNLDKAHSEVERDLADHPDQMDSPDNLDMPESPEAQEPQDRSPKALPFKDPLAQPDVQDSPETQDSQETQDSPETLDHQDSPETLVPTELPVNPEAQASPDQMELLVTEASATIAHLHAQLPDTKRNCADLDNITNIHNALQKVLNSDYGVFCLEMFIRNVSNR